MPEPKPAAPADARASDAAAWMLCGLAAVFGAWALQVGWFHGILDVHAWRQSHTAISTQEMLRGGPFWRYRTPIFGPPWQWPLELPVFQWLVASAVRQLGTGLEPTGRAVSVAFFVGALAALWVALDAASVAPRHRPVMLALVWASPLYIFWSRTFMIESTALCFGLAYFAAVHRATRADGGAIPIVACICTAAVGALAGATKVTTFVPCLAAGGLIVVMRWRRGGWSRRRGAATLVAAFVIPLAAAGTWLLFADSQKASNRIAAQHVWSGERDQRLADPEHVLAQFGSLALHSRLRSWYAAPANVILGRTRHTVVGSGWVFGAAVAVLLAFRRRLAASAVCGLLYMLPIAIFMNLFLVHVYYSYENGFLVALIVGFAIVTLLEESGVVRWGGVALLAAALAAMATGYRSGYFADQQSTVNQTVRIADLTRQLTAPDEVMVIYGLEYSPVVPYAASRRAIMDDENRSVYDPAIRATLAALGEEGARVGALVACGESRDAPAVRANISALGFPMRPRYVEPFCELYIRP